MSVSIFLLQSPEPALTSQATTLASSLQKHLARLSSTSPDVSLVALPTSTFNVVAISLARRRASCFASRF